MGKVYEALSRAQDDDLDLFDESPEEEEGREEGQDESEDDSGSEGLVPRSSEKFNFMRYSLGSSAMVVKDRTRTGAAAGNALAPRSLTKPSRELTVIPERLDPHLVAFHNFDRP